MLETALDAEMTEHLGYDKHDPVGRVRQLPQWHPTQDSVHRDRAGRDRGAGDDSLRQRLEIANRGNRELSVENRRLRRQLACAVGRLRADTGRHPPLIGYSSKRPKEPL